MAQSVDDVAAYLLERLGALTVARLQRLVYYTQAWHLADHHVHLFEDPIEARADGPVVLRLHDQAGGRDEVHEWPAGDPRRLGARARDVIEWVLGAYGSFPDAELARIVRAEAPWRLARQGRRVARRPAKAIDPTVMATYYDRLRSSPDAAVLVAVGSARLEGHEFRPREVDLLRAAAGGTRAADDIVAELVRRHRAS